MTEEEFEMLVKRVRAVGPTIDPDRSALERAAKVCDDYAQERRVEADRYGDQRDRENFAIAVARRDAAKYLAIAIRKLVRT